MFGDELNETADQVDNLLDELNELVARRQESQSNFHSGTPSNQIMVLESHDSTLDNYYTQDEPSSPFLPKRSSMMGKRPTFDGGMGGVGGSNAGGSSGGQAHQQTSPFEVKVNLADALGPTELPQRQEGSGYTTGVI